MKSYKQRRVKDNNHWYPKDKKLRAEKSAAQKNNNLLVAIDNKSTVIQSPNLNTNNTSKEGNDNSPVFDINNVAKKIYQGIQLQFNLYFLCASHFFILNSQFNKIDFALSNSSLSHNTIIWHITEYQQPIKDCILNFLYRFKVQSQMVMKKVNANQLSVLPEYSIEIEIGKEFLSLLSQFYLLYNCDKRSWEFNKIKNLEIHKYYLSELTFADNSQDTFVKTILSNTDVLSNMFLHTWFARSVLMHFYEDNVKEIIDFTHRKVFNYIARNPDDTVNCDITNFNTLNLETKSLTNICGKQNNRFARYFERESVNCTRWKKC